MSRSSDARRRALQRSGTFESWVPEIALVDINLGADSGFDLARRLAERLEGDAPKVILISTHDYREFFKLIESSPAVGFLAKTELSAERIYQLLASADG